MTQAELNHLIAHIDWKAKVIPGDGNKTKANIIALLKRYLEPQEMMGN